MAGGVQVGTAEDRAAARATVDASLELVLEAAARQQATLVERVGRELAAIRRLLEPPTETVVLELPAGEIGRVHRQYPPGAMTLDRVLVVAAGDTDARVDVAGLYGPTAVTLTVSAAVPVVVLPVGRHLGPLDVTAAASISNTGLAVVVLELRRAEDREGG